MSFPKEWFIGASPNFSKQNKRKAPEKSSSETSRSSNTFQKVDTIFGNKKPRLDAACTDLPNLEKVRRLPIPRDADRLFHSNEKQKENLPQILVPGKPAAKTILPMPYSNPYLNQRQAIAEPPSSDYGRVNNHQGVIELGQDVQLFNSNPPGISIQKRLRTPQFFFLANLSLCKLFFDQIANMAMRLASERRPFASTDEPFIFIRSLTKEDQQELIQSHLMSREIELSSLSFLFLMEHGDLIYKEIIKTTLTGLSNVSLIKTILHEQIKKLEGAQNLLAPGDLSLPNIFNVKIWLSQQSAVLEHKGLEAFKTSFGIVPRVNLKPEVELTNKRTQCKSDLSFARDELKFSSESLKSGTIYQLWNPRSIKFFTILFSILSKANAENRFLCRDDAKCLIDEFKLDSTEAMAFLLDSNVESQKNLSLLSCLFFIEGGKDVYRSVIEKAINQSPNLSVKDNLIFSQIKHLTKAISSLGINGPKKSFEEVLEWLNASLDAGLNLRWCNLKGKRLSLLEGDEKCQVSLSDKEHIFIWSYVELIEKNDDAERIADALLKYIPRMPAKINFENGKSLAFLSLLLFFSKKTIFQGGLALWWTIQQKIVQEKGHWTSLLLCLKQESEIIQNPYVCENYQQAIGLVQKKAASIQDSYVAAPNNFPLSAVMALDVVNKRLILNRLGVIQPLSDLACHFFQSYYASNQIEQILLLEMLKNREYKTLSYSLFCDGIMPASICECFSLYQNDLSELEQSKAIQEFCAELTALIQFLKEKTLQWDSTKIFDCKMAILDLSPNIKKGFPFIIGREKDFLFVYKRQQFSLAVKSIENSLEIKVLRIFSEKISLFRNQKPVTFKDDKNFPFSIIHIGSKAFNLLYLCLCIENGEVLVEQYLDEISSTASSQKSAFELIDIQIRSLKETIEYMSNELGIARTVENLDALAERVKSKCATLFAHRLSMENKSQSTQEFAQFEQMFNNTLLMRIGGAEFNVLENGHEILDACSFSNPAHSLRLDQWVKISDLKVPEVFAEIYLPTLFLFLPEGLNQCKQFVIKRIQGIEDKKSFLDEIKKSISESLATLRSVVNPAILSQRDRIFLFFEELQEQNSKVAIRLTYGILTVEYQQRKFDLSISDAFGKIFKNAELAIFQLHEADWNVKVEGIYLPFLFVFRSDGLKILKEIILPYLISNTIYSTSKMAIQLIKNSFCMSQEILEKNLHLPKLDVYLEVISYLEQLEKEEPERITPMMMNNIVFEVSPNFINLSKKVPVDIELLDRIFLEKKYAFRLPQGGINKNGFIFPPFLLLSLPNGIELFKVGFERLCNSLSIKDKIEKCDFFINQFQQAYKSIGEEFVKSSSYLSAISYLQAMRPLLPSLEPAVDGMKRQKLSTLYSFHKRFFSRFRNYLNAPKTGKGFRALLKNEQGFFAFQNSKKAPFFTKIRKICEEVFNDSNIPESYKEWILKDFFSFFSACASDSSEPFSQFEKLFASNAAEKKAICERRVLLNPRSMDELLETFLKIKLAEYEHHIETLFKPKIHSKPRCGDVPCFFVCYNSQNQRIIKPVLAYFSDKGILKGLFSDNSQAANALNDLLGTAFNESQEIIFSEEKLEQLRKILREGLPGWDRFILLEEKIFLPSIETERKEKDSLKKTQGEDRGASKANATTVGYSIIHKDEELLYEEEIIKPIKHAKNYALPGVSVEKEMIADFWQKTSLDQCESIYKKEQRKSKSLAKIKQLEWNISSLINLKEDTQKRTMHMMQAKPYQQAGIDRISALKEHGLSGILAWWMGLGKTLASIEFILRAIVSGDEKNIAVFVINSVLDQFMQEVRERIEQVKFAALLGSAFHLDELGDNRIEYIWAFFSSTTITVREALLLIAALPEESKTDFVYFLNLICPKENFKEVLKSNLVVFLYGKEVEERQQIILRLTKIAAQFITLSDNPDKLFEEIFSAIDSENDDVRLANFIGNLLMADPSFPYLAAKKENFPGKTTEEFKRIMAFSCDTQMGVYSFEKPLEKKSEGLFIYFCVHHTVKNEMMIRDFANRGNIGLGIVDEAHTLASKKSSKKNEGLKKLFNLLRAQDSKCQIIPLSGTFVKGSLKGLLDLIGAFNPKLIPQKTRHELENLFRQSTLALNKILAKDPALKNKEILKEYKAEIEIIKNSYAQLLILNKLLSKLLVRATLKQKNVIQDWKGRIPQKRTEKLKCSMKELGICQEVQRGVALLNREFKKGEDMLRIQNELDSLLIYPGITNDNIQEIVHRIKATAGNEEEFNLELSKSYKASALIKSQAFKNAIENGKKISVYVHHIYAGNIIKAYIESAFTNLKVHAVNGSISIENRAKILKEFRASAGPEVGVISILTGGTGLNFEFVDVMVILEMLYDPQELQQIKGRIVRVNSVGHKVIYVFKKNDEFAVEKNKYHIIAAKKGTTKYFQTDFSSHPEHFSLYLQALMSSILNISYKKRRHLNNLDLKKEMEGLIKLFKPIICHPDFSLMCDSVDPFLHSSSNRGVQEDDGIYDTDEFDDVMIDLPPELLDFGQNAQELLKIISEIPDRKASLAGEEDLELEIALQRSFEMESSSSSPKKSDKGKEKVKEKMDVDDDEHLKRHLAKQEKMDLKMAIQMSRDYQYEPSSGGLEIYDEGDDGGEMRYGEEKEVENNAIERDEIAMDSFAAHQAYSIPIPNGTRKRAKRVASYILNNLHNPEIRDQLRSANDQLFSINQLKGDAGRTEMVQTLYKEMNIAATQKPEKPRHMYVYSFDNSSKSYIRVDSIAVREGFNPMLKPIALRQLPSSIGQKTVYDLLIPRDWLREYEK